MSSSLAAIIGLAIPLILSAQSPSFHHAPASAKQMKNPYAGQAGAVRAGKALFEQKCAACHGASGKGTGSVPALTEGPIKSATQGEVFWFITKGDINNGMPAWASLPEAQRWQLVSFIKSLSRSEGAAPKSKASTGGA